MINIGVHYLNIKSSFKWILQIVTSCTSRMKYTLILMTVIIKLVS